MNKTATYELTELKLLTLSELENEISDSSKMNLKELEGLWSAIYAINNLPTEISIEMKITPWFNTLVCLSNFLRKEDIDLSIMYDDENNFYVIEKGTEYTFRKGPVSKTDIDTILLPIISYFMIMKKKEINLHD